MTGSLTSDQAEDMLRRARLRKVVNLDPDQFFNSLIPIYNALNPINHILSVECVSIQKIPDLDGDHEW